MLSDIESEDESLPRFDGRSAAEWLAEAERLDRMAVEFKENPRLRNVFRELAADARAKAAKLSS